MSAPTPDASILNFVVRMVVPMRREFGRSLDVQLFLRDTEYARLVLDQALASRDQRLRDYAEYVLRHLSGARQADPPLASAAASTPASSVAASSTPSGAPGEPATLGVASEAELRARMLKKYTTGLR